MSTFETLLSSRRSLPRFDPLSRRDSLTLVIINQRLKAVSSFATLGIHLSYVTFDYNFKVNNRRIYTLSYTTHIEKDINMADRRRLIITYRGYR